MERNNDVYKVLVTSGNQTPMDAGKTISELLPGQIGIFDANSNLSFDVVKAAKVKDFYMAVGIDKDGDGVTDDVMKSSGKKIAVKDIVSYTFRPHTAGRPMKFKLKNYTADCETEYGIKLEFRNAEIYQMQGYNQYTKTYSIKTSCCHGCAPTCPSGDANEITRMLKANIENNPKPLVKVKAIARQDLVVATHGVSKAYNIGDEVLDADILKMMAYNATQKNDTSKYVYTDLEFETIGIAMKEYSAYNFQNYGLRQTMVIPSKIEGFKCNGEVEVTQTLVYEEGKGADIKPYEFMALGWTDSPYRVNSITGFPNYYKSLIDDNKTYDMIALCYDEVYNAAWDKFFMAEATILVIPEGDRETAIQTARILDVLVERSVLDDLEYAATCAMGDATAIERTQDKNSSNDGLTDDAA